MTSSTAPAILTPIITANRLTPPPASPADRDVIHDVIVVRRSTTPAVPRTRYLLILYRSMGGHQCKSNFNKPVDSLQGSADVNQDGIS